MRVAPGGACLEEGKLSVCSLGQLSLHSMIYIKGAFDCCPPDPFSDSGIICNAGGSAACRNTSWPPKDDRKY